MDLHRPLTRESAGTTGRRRVPEVQPRRPSRPRGPQTANCPQMMTTPGPWQRGGGILHGRPHTSRTYLRTENVPFPLMTTVRPQWSVGRRSPRGTSTSSPRAASQPLSKTYKHCCFI